MGLEHKDWKGTTGGTTWMQRTLVAWLSVIDQRFIYAVLVLVVPFYMLFNHKGYISIYRFYRQGFGFPWWKAFVYVYANHFRFGQIIIDRFAAFGGRKFKFVNEGDNLDDYKTLSRQESGFVQLHCHMGNYELAGYTLKQDVKTMYALVFMGETETMMENRRRMFSHKDVIMVPVKPDMSHIFELNNALQAGQIVSMPGDRIFGSSKSLTCTFLGKSIKLPLGPFQLAILRNVPMVVIFVMKKRYDTYKVHYAMLNDDPSLSKKERAQNLADQFAGTMDNIVRMYPAQWFNYFDVWAGEDQK